MLMNPHEALKKVRKITGKRQVELAEAVGLQSVRAWRDWENGTTPLTTKRMTAAARAHGFASWSDLLRAVQPAPSPNGHGDLIPVLANIPASFGMDGEVTNAYDFTEAVDYMPGDIRDASDPRMFGLIIHGDSMAPKYPAGSYVACSPKHWIDHGYADGFCYALLLDTGESTVKRVHLLDDGHRLELVPINPAHPPRRIQANTVKIAALVRGSYIVEPMPEI